MDLDHAAIVREGPSYRLAVRLGLAPVSWRRRMAKLLLLIAITWLPLLLLTLAAGTAFGDRVEVPFFHDPVVHSRFLFVLPLLEVAEIVVALGLVIQSRYFLKSGIVPSDEHARFDVIKASVICWRQSTMPELLAVACAFAVAIGRVYFKVNSLQTNWERFDSGVSLAGWWYNLVCLPILFFFLFRWSMVFVLWGSFLLGVSRLDLILTATHPDRSGGLGFLGWGMASFAPVLMAISAVVSGGIAYRIMHGGESLGDLKYELLIFIVSMLGVTYSPLLAFASRLSRCRYRALLEFGSALLKHNRAFDEKWIRDPEADSRNLLGNPDASSLADLAAAYEHVQRMRPIPLDKQTVALLIGSTVLPLLPLVATSIPLADIFTKLVKLML